MSETRDRLFAAAIILAAAGWSLVRFWGQWPIDLSALYFAGLAWAEGRPELIYLAQPGFFGVDSGSEIRGLARSADPQAGFVTPFVYAPIFAALTAPIAKAIPPQVAFDIALALNVTLLIAGGLLARSIAPVGPRWAWAAVLALLYAATLPGHSALYYNQPQILAGALVLLMAALCLRGWPTLGGAALGLAMALKVSPAIFCFWLWAFAGWRGLVGFALCIGGIAVLSVAVAGLPLHHAWLDQMQRLSEAQLLADVNLSLRALIEAARLGLSQPLPFARAVEASPGAAQVALAVLVLGLTACAIRMRRAPTPHDPLRMLIALWVLLILCSPVGWAHYLTAPFALVPAMALWLGWARTAALVMALLGLLSPITAVLLDISGWAGPFWSGSLLGVVALVLLMIAALAPGRDPSDHGQARAHLKAPGTGA